jgi:integrase
MNWVSEPLSTMSNLLQDQTIGRFEAEAGLYLANQTDQAKQHFLGLFFKSVLGAVLEKSTRPNDSGVSCLLTGQDVLKLASKHLYHDWNQDLNKGITCLNEAISYLNRTRTITLPMIDPSKIIVKKTRRLAVTIDQTRWSSYLKVVMLYDFFLNHFEVLDNEEELAFAVIFSSIVNGCHFHRSYLSLIDTSPADFDPIHSWIMLEKKYRNGRFIPKVKSRFFLSAISVIYLLRLIDVASERIKSVNDYLFPESFSRRNRTGYEFAKKFKFWLDRLVCAFDTRRRQDMHGLSGTTTITHLSIKELYHGAQIWTVLRYPFFTTSYLSQKIISGQLSAVNYRAFFSRDHVLYTTKLDGGGARRSWLRAQYPNSTDTDKEINEEAYLLLMHVHSAITQRIQGIQGNISRKEKAGIALEIRELSESLPYPSSTLFRRENGYLSNYKLLLDWLAVIVQTKIKPNTALDYVSDLANAFFFVLADTSILSLDRYELSDAVLETIYWNTSPRTQRTIKSKLRQFLSFLSSRYPLPALDWNHPDYWVVDEPMEREIMGFSEFDMVWQGMEKVCEPEHCDMLRAVLILLFYVGLRIHEAALLSHDAAYIDSEMNILIKKSKTRSGKRSLPLHYLLADKELKFFREYVLKRRPKGPRNGLPLFSLDGVSFLEPEVLANMITTVIYECVGRHITCHQLRHSFASWFLLRWYALLYGTKTLERFFVDCGHPAFTPAELSKLKTLFLGEGPEKIGDKYFMHAIIVLGRLLGHAGPDTTVSVYTHTIDVLYKFLASEKDGMISLSIPRAAKMLNISYPTAKKLAREDGVTLTAMAEHCLRSFKLPQWKV